MALFVLRKLILQSYMRSHPVELVVWCLVGPFVNFHTSCVRTAKALARLRECAGLPEPSLVAYVISTTISWELAQLWFILISIIFFVLFNTNKTNSIQQVFQVSPQRHESNRHRNDQRNPIWASSWDYGNHIGDQRRLRRACASAQSRQSLRCSHTWSMEVDEGSDI